MRRNIRGAAIAAALAGGVSVPVSAAEVAAFTVASVDPVPGGAAFGATGAYELLRADADFTIYPTSDRGRSIVDMDQEPTGAGRAGALWGAGRHPAPGGG